MTEIYDFLMRGGLIIPIALFSVAALAVFVERLLALVSIG